MSDLNCPFCPVIRPSRSQLQYHIDSAHPDDARERPAPGYFLRCPYCPETRQARMSLKNHVLQRHAQADTPGNLDAATKAAKWVNVMADEPTEQAPATVTVLPTAADTPVQPLCICGDPIQLLDEDTPDWWIHSPGSNTPCLDAVPARTTIASQGRKQLSEQMADTGERLAKAGREIAELKAQADAVLARLEALDKPVVDAVALRKATLNQVWDKLMDAGNITGAQLVMRMIGTNFEGDWS